MTNNKSSKRLHPNVWVLTATSFFTDVSSEMLANLLPLFLFNVLGLRTVTIGFIDGIAETTASLVKLFSGVLSDYLKRRKTLTIIGYGLSTLAKPFLYFATNWIWVLGVRFTDRVGKGIRTAPRDALLAGSVDAEHRGFAFGLHRAGDTAGAFTGLVIALIVIWASQTGAPQLTRASFQLVVLVSIIPAALAVIILALGLREVEKPDNANAPAISWRKNWKKLGRNFWVFLLVMILFTLGNSSDSFIILRGQERGLDIFQIFGMLLTFNAIYALLSSPAGTLSDRIGRRRLIITGWLLYGLIYVGLALARTGYHIWTMFGLYGMFYALTEGTVKAYVADLVPQEQRGTAYGLFHAAVGLTALPASLIAGVLWQGIGLWTGFGASAPFLFGAAMALIAGVLLKFGVR